MDINPEDEIVIAALIKRFTEQRLPRAMDLKRKVEEGKKLENTEVDFLNTVLNDAKYVLRYSDKYPQYQELVTKGIQLYTEITEKALENEKKLKPKK